MAISETIELFDAKNIRVIWDDEKEKYYFSIVDIVAILTESIDYQTARNYWKVLKNRLLKEGNESVTNCNQLKMQSHTDGKRYLIDVADTEQVLRLIQSIPSKKAEPFKLWLAQVGRERLAQLSDPEKSIDQAIRDYHRLGYSEAWINQRIKSIEIRKGLTDEWQRGGITKEQDYASLTDIISKTWSGLTTREYKHLKGLRQENLRDNMTNVELMLNGLAEATATELSKKRNPEGFIENAAVAREGGEVARNARMDIEQRLGESVVTNSKAIDYIQAKDELSFPKKE